MDKRLKILVGAMVGFIVDIPASPLLIAMDRAIADSIEKGLATPAM